MSASPQQLQAAVDFCLAFAKRMLERSGEFFPIGAVLGPTGDVEARAGCAAEEHPQVMEPYDLTADGFRAEAADRKILGAVLAVDVNIPSQFSAKWPDGVRLRLESPDVSRLIYVPYRITKSALTRSKHQVQFAEPFTVDVPHEFFVAKLTEPALPSEASSVPA
jgi:hypothetical protein